MFRTIFKAFAFATIFATPIYAENLQAPKGDVLLTITGDLTVTNVDQSIQLDIKMLEALKGTSFQTATIWTEGQQVFEGVSLHDLVEAFGITGSVLKATAINDYAVEIPLSDAIEGGPIVAYRMDGKAMSVRDKGPLWIVYPYDANEDFQTEVIYSRSIWQLDRLIAVD